MLDGMKLDSSPQAGEQLSEPSETLDESITVVAEGLTISGRPLSAQAWLAKRSAAMTGLTMPPAVAAQARVGDIEALVQWALSQTGYLPWRNPSDEDLAMDHGWDVVPKATRALYQPSGGIALKRAVDDDAALVIGLIKALPAATAAQVIACGREKIRPNALIGVEPQQVLQTIGWRKAAKKRKGKKTCRKPVQVMVWEPCDPAAICAARAAYARWHAALALLDRQVRGQLRDWYITPFSAQAAPWDKP